MIYNQLIRKWRRLRDRVGLLVILSVCLCAASGKTLCIHLCEIFTKDKGDFILEVIRIGIHCHLEVTVAQQFHFRIKSTNPYF